MLMILKNSLIELSSLLELAGIKNYYIGTDVEGINFDFMQSHIIGESWGNYDPHELG